jgi:hypothetical protein
MTLTSMQSATSASDVPRCLDCDYCLSGLASSACPECGRQFDPDDATTFHRGLPMPALLRRWKRPIGAGPYVLLGAGCLLVSPLLISPGCMYMFAGVFFLAPVWFLMLGYFLVQTSMRQFIRVRYRRRFVEFADDALRWARVFLLLLALTVVCTLGIPMRVAFYLSQPGLDKMRVELAASGATTVTRRVGVWSVTAQAYPEGVVAFNVNFGSAGGLFPGGGEGFLYLPENVPVPGYNYGADGWLLPRWRYFTTD